MYNLKSISEEFDKLYPLYLSGTIEVSPDSVKDFFLSAFTEVLESLKGEEIEKDWANGDYLKGHVDGHNMSVQELNDKIKRIINL